MMFYGDTRGLDSVFCALDARHTGAMGAAIELSGGFYSVTDDPASTVRAGGRQLLNRAFKRVKCMIFSLINYLERFVVVVSA